MANITFTEGSGLQDSIFGKSQEPIKMFLEKRGEAFEQASMLPELFNISPSNHWGEKFTTMTAMEGFQPVGENGDYPVDGMQEGFSKFLEHMTWKNSFSLSREIVEDGKLMDLKKQPAGFITSYYRTREKFGAALLGAAIGTKIALLINEDILKIMMLVALPCAAILLMLKKDFGKENNAPAREYTPQQELTRAALIGLGLGCYDGLIGPGTGTFMIMAFTMALSMDLLTASGCAKIANLCSNVASAVLFIFSGKVWWLLALPAAACNMLGAYCGARYAMKGGSKRVRGMIFVVLGLLFIKMGYELLF